MAAPPLTISQTGWKFIGYKPTLWDNLSSQTLKVLARFVPKMGYLRTWSHLWFWHGEEQISSVLEWLDTSCSNVAMLMGELTQDSLRGCLQIKHLIIRHPESTRTLFFFGFCYLGKSKDDASHLRFHGAKEMQPNRTGPLQKLEWPSSHCQSLTQDHH